MKELNQKLDQVINMLNSIGAEMGVEFPVDDSEDEVEIPKEKYLSMPPDKREMIDKKKIGME